jgi:hypothetical protein
MGNVVWAQLGLYDFCLLFGSGLVLVIESATLVRVIRGSRHKFVIKILAILILANLTYLAEETVNMNELKTLKNTIKKY